MRSRAISVQFMGGFGNQLFQLCAGLSATPEKRKMFIYQRDSNTDMKKLVSRLIKQGVEVELIPSERIMFAQVANRAIGLLISLELGNRHTYFPRIFKSLLKAIAVSILYPFLKVRGIYVAPELGDVPILEKSNAKLIVGYFQTFRTSENTEVYKVLQRALDEIELDNDKERVSENSNGNLVIHIRLGDYLAEKNFGVLGTNYYLNALRMISKDGIERISIFRMISKKLERFMKMLSLGRSSPFLGKELECLGYNQWMVQLWKPLM